MIYLLLKFHILNVDNWHTKLHDSDMINISKACHAEPTNRWNPLDSRDIESSRSWDITSNTPNTSIPIVNQLGSKLLSYYKVVTCGPIINWEKVKFKFGLILYILVDK